MHIIVSGVELAQLELWLFLFLQQELLHVSIHIAAQGGPLQIFFFISQNNKRHLAVSSLHPERGKEREKLSCWTKGGLEENLSSVLQKQSTQLLAGGSFRDCAVVVSFFGLSANETQC